MSDQQGPRTVTIPAETETICNGCEFLKTSAGMRGQNKVTNHFWCDHANFKTERPLMVGETGRTIHFNHEGNCQTPDWCPFNKK